MNDAFEGSVPLYTGVLRGIRRWNIDALGRLTPVSHGGTVWRPGLNVATCVHESRPARPIPGRIERRLVAVPKDEPLLPGSLAYEHWLSEDAFYRLTAQERHEYVLGWHDCWVPSAHWRPGPPAHEVPQVGCGCGFWAYFKDDAGSRFGGQVAGIIEAQGRIICGTLGYRAEKARIVALVDPNAPWVPPRALKPLTVVGLILWFLVGVAIALRTAGESTLAIWSLTGLSLGVLLVRTCSKASPHLRSDGEVFIKVRRNYPDVRFYRSLKEAQRSHPVTMPPPRDPSPDDPDFWIRSAPAPARPTVSFPGSPQRGRSIVVGLVLFGLVGWAIHSGQASSPPEPWRSSSSIDVEVTACGGQLTPLNDLNGQLTIRLRNEGTERVEGKAKVMVIAGDSHVYRSIRSTLDPGQVGDFSFGFTMLAVYPATDIVACQPDIPLERPPGHEGTDPQDDNTCWGDSKTGIISETFDSLEVPHCETPSVT